MADIARLAELIEPEARALGFALVRVRLFGDGEGRTLQVMAEDPATGQLVVEQCMALSHRISDLIDAIEEAGEELIAGAYHLEVSSPGIDRPLTRPHDFANWAGHEIRIRLAEPVVAGEAGGIASMRGVLLGIGEAPGLPVTVEDRRAGRIEIPFARIIDAQLILTDRLIAAARPLDLSGVDDFDTDTDTDTDTDEEEALS